MVLSSVRIIQAKKLLNSSGDKNKAAKLVKILNYYHFSPIFILCNGFTTQKRLSQKYNIKNYSSFNDKLKAIPTAMFCDELFIIMAFIVMIISMCNVWLPNLQTVAYNDGYNKLHANIDAHRLSCFKHDYQICIPCNQGIDIRLLKNNTYNFKIRVTGGCNDMAPDYCSMVNKTGINAVQTAIANNNYLFIDPNSFVNDTYITYILFGREYNGMWRAIKCNRIIQAEYEVNAATNKWITSFVFILIGAIVFYLIMICIIYAVHKNIEIDPENYLLTVNTE